MSSNNDDTGTAGEPGAGSGLPQWSLPQSESEHYEVPDHPHAAEPTSGSPQRPFQPTGMGTPTGVPTATTVPATSAVPADPAPRKRRRLLLVSALAGVVVLLLAATGIGYLSGRGSHVTAAPEASGQPGADASAQGSTDNSGQDASRAADGGPAAAYPGGAPAKRHAAGRAGASRPGTYAMSLPDNGAIEQCSNLQCTIVDAVRFNHPVLRAVELILYLHDEDDNSAKVAVLKEDGENLSTVQNLDLDARGLSYSAGKDKLHFLRIPVDSTGMVFLVVPGETGRARALLPADSQTSPMQMYDFSETVAQCQGSGMVATDWGLFDDWGNYGLTIETDETTCQATWNGDEYAID